MSKLMVCSGLTVMLALATVCLAQDDVYFDNTDHNRSFSRKVVYDGTDSPPIGSSAEGLNLVYGLPDRVKGQLGSLLSENLIHYKIMFVEIGSVGGGAPVAIRLGGNGPSWVHVLVESGAVLGGWDLRLVADCRKRVKGSQVAAKTEVVVDSSKIRAATPLAKSWASNMFFTPDESCQELVWLNLNLRYNGPSSDKTGAGIWILEYWD